MKGYYTASGYMGCVEGQWMLFPDEGEYLDWIRENVSE